MISVKLSFGGREAPGTCARQATQKRRPGRSVAPQCPHCPPVLSDIKRPHPECRYLRPCYVNNALSFFVAVGNLPRPAFITSSANVKYRSPKVPVILECKPVASRPAWPATISPRPWFLCG